MSTGLTIPYVSKAEIMDKLQVVQFDIRGTRPENRVLREKIPLKYKDCPWIVPNGSPYFAERALVDLFNEAGGRLTFGTDYWFEGEFEPFCEVTGRSICSFVKLSDKVLAENEFVSMTYQSIGAWFVPRNSIEEWVREIYIGKIPIPWSKVYNVPPTLPSSKHAHTIKTEIGDWYELTFFFTYLANYYSTRDPNLYIEADQVINESFARLKQVKAQQLARLNNHDKDYGDPHQITKFHLQLGNLDNFGTATPEQDVAGTAANLFSTPEGVMRLSEEYALESDAIMRNGVLPLSYFGNGGYIPPTILGSFEGLGTETECAAMCVEADGSLMVLSNHFDGRTRGLYFGKIEDRSAVRPKHTFTNYRYEPPFLANTELVLNRVVMGSGGKVIMAGVEGTNNWFVAMTNGTLNPKAHAFVKCDVSALATFVNDPAKPAYSSSHLGVIHHMGDYLVLVQTYNLDVNNAPTRQAFFRVLVSDVEAGKDVTWTRFNISYTNWAGSPISGAQYMEIGVATVTSGKISRVGAVKGTPEITSFTTEGRVVSLSSPKAASRTLFNITFLIEFRLTYLSGTTNKNTRHVLEVRHDFNPATGAFTAKAKTPPYTHNFLTATIDQADQYVSLRHMLNALDRPATVLLDTGEFVSSTLFTNQAGYPVQVVVGKIKGRNTPEAFLDGLLNTANATIEYRRVIQPSILAPVLSGTHQAGMVYQNNGELYGAVNPATFNREIFFRQLSGGFQLREEVKNLVLGGINARPLTDDIYTTNLFHHDPMISLTGDAGFLTTASIEAGLGSFSSCGYSSVMGLPEALPTNPALRAPANSGVLISFPRTVTQVLESNPKKVTYTGETFYGINQRVVDQLFGYIPADETVVNGWCFTLNMLTVKGVNGLNDLGLAVIQVTWEDEKTGYPRMQMILAEPIIDTPSVSRPNLYVINNLQILDTPNHFKATPYPLADDKVNMQFRSYKDLPGYTERPIMVGYLDDQMVMKCFMNGCFYINVGWNTPLCNIFDINLTTKKFQNIGAGKTPMGFGDQVTVIPKVGMTDHQLDVVAGIPPTYVPASPGRYQCPITKQISDGRMDKFWNYDWYVPHSLIRRHSEGVNASLRSWDCVCWKGPGSGGLEGGFYPEARAQIYGHLVWIPPVNPAPPTPERWRCKTSGIAYSDYRMIAGKKIPSIIQFDNSTKMIVCKSCNTVFDRDYSDANYAYVRDNHFVFMPEEGSPLTPGTPDEFYIGLPAGKFYANTGGGAAIARKTVGSTISHYLTSSVYPSSRWAIFFQEEVPLMINGMMYRMPPGVVDLRDVDPDPRNKTFYIYAMVEDNKPSYMLSTIKLRKSGFLLKVATVKTNDKQVLTIARSSVFTVGDLFFSHSRDGGTIPVSSGPPQDEGSFIFLKSSELLP